MTKGNLPWSDEIEICVIRSFIRRPFIEGNSRRAAISRHMDVVMAELGTEADLNMVAAAVAAHMPH